MGLQTIKNLTSDTGKLLNLHTYNLTVHNFAWCFAHTNEDGSLNSDSLVLRCKDHLIDCLNTKSYTGLAYKEYDNRDTPITLAVFLPATANVDHLKEGITNLLNPLETKYKWKQTTIEYLGTFTTGNIYGDPVRFKAVKVTASKMWKKNGFIFSIWASLLRVGYFYPTFTLDTFIEKAQKVNNYCNEITYLKTQVAELGLEPYKKAWDRVLNSLHLYKDLYTTSVHKNRDYHQHGYDGIFMCFQQLFHYYSSKGTEGFLNSHPYVTSVTQGLPNKNVNYDDFRSAA